MTDYEYILNIAGTSHLFNQLEQFCTHGTDMSFDQMLSWKQDVEDHADANGSEVEIRAIWSTTGNPVMLSFTPDMFDRRAIEVD